MFYYPVDRIDNILDRLQQATLADSLGVDRAYLCRVLQGRQEPSPRLLVGLAHCLNRALTPPVTVDELYQFLTRKQEYYQVEEQVLREVALP